MKELVAQQCDLVVNLSASPWHHGKGNVRETLITDAAKALACPVVYCNAVGGNDELIFDGRSVVASADGVVVAALAAFQEELRVVDPSTAVTPGSAAPPIAASYAQPEMKDVFEALVLGLRDYAGKTRFQEKLGGPEWRH